MNIAVARSGGTVNDELVALLNGFNGYPAIGEGIALTVGSEPGRLADTANPVLGFVIRPEEIFTAWLITPNGFHVFELARDGQSLTVSVPWSRVSRVVLATDNAASSLSVEIAADRVAVAGELREGQMAGVLRPAGYVVSAAESADRARLNAFAAQLRRLVR